MKKSVKVSILIASILSVVGLAVCTVGLFLMNFDFSKLNTMPTKTNTHVVTEEFHSISIQVNTADVVFVFSEEEECRVVCQEPEGLTHSVSMDERVLGGRLLIKVQDNRKWYDQIGISWGEIKVTVYLPKSEYCIISIETDTGDVKIPEDFRFDDLNVRTKSGDIYWNSVVNCTVDDISYYGRGNSRLQTDTGNVFLDGAYAGRIFVESKSGDVEIKNSLALSLISVKAYTGNVLFCDSSSYGALEVETDTGDVTFERSGGSFSNSIKTDTGDVIFDGFKGAGDLLIKTQTGDVTGSLLKKKIIFATSKTGKIQVPKFEDGAKCEITTDTGDIILTIAD